MSQKAKTSYRFWNIKEQLFLIENYSKISAKEIAGTLNRKEYHVFQKAAKLGIKKSIKWSQTEIEYIKQNITKSALQLSRELKKPYSTTLKKMKQLGAEK